MPMNRTPRQNRQRLSRHEIKKARGYLPALHAGWCKKHAVRLAIGGDLCLFCLGVDLGQGREFSYMDKRNTLTMNSALEPGSLP